MLEKHAPSQPLWGCSVTEEALATVKSLRVSERSRKAGDSVDADNVFMCSKSRKMGRIIRIESYRQELPSYLRIEANSPLDRF